MIDSHCHLNDESFIKDPKSYIEDSKKEGVNTFLVVGWDVKSSILAVKLAHQYKEVFATVGIHPSDVKSAKQDDLKQIESLLTDKKVVAVGEIGFDYHYEIDEEGKAKQKEYFLAQLKLAEKYNLPVSIHSRDAGLDTLNMLKSFSPKRKGVLHCYSYSVEMLQDFLNLGFIIGLGGTVTFKNAKKVIEVARQVPLDKFVLETDSPFLAPTPHRGELNHSKFIPLIRDKIAEIKGVKSSLIEDATDENFKTLFLVK